jgi:hypothetical protein
MGLSDVKLLINCSPGILDEEFYGRIQEEGAHNVSLSAIIKNILQLNSVASSDRPETQGPNI